MKKRGMVTCYLAVFRYPLISMSTIRSQRNSHNQITNILRRTNTRQYIEVKVL